MHASSTATSPVQVAVITPQAVVGAGLAAILADTGGRFALASFDVGGPDPDIALYDVAFLAAGDLSTLEILVEKTSAAVLLVASALRPDLTAKALAHGADGYFDLGSSREEVVAALESTTTGWQEGDPGPNPTVGSSAEEQESLTSCRVGLSAREHEVLALIARGRSNREIGAELFLGVNTVKTYVRGAYAKIGATNRSSAVAWAIDHGLPAD